MRAFDAMKNSTVQRLKFPEFKEEDERQDIVRKISRYLSRKNLPLVLDQEDGLIVLRLEEKRLRNTASG